MSGHLRRNWRETGKRYDQLLALRFALVVHRDTKFRNELAVVEYFVR